jgi:hypothetical protein
VGNLRRGLAVAAALMTLSGCWLQTGFGPARQNSNPFESGLTAANVDSLAPAWTSQVNTNFGGQPLLTGSAVYVTGVERGSGTANFVVRALGRGSGTQLWQHAFPVDPFAPVSPGVLLAVGTDRVIAWVAPLGGGQELVALDPDTGATLATQPVPGASRPDAFAVGDSVIAATDVDGTASTARIVVRSRSTFAVLWSSPAVSAFGDVPVPVLIAGDRLYANTTISGAPGVAAFVVDGCGAAECSALFAAPVPPPPPAGTFDTFSAGLLAASDDGHLLFRRTSSLGGGIPTNDLVALTADGDPAWSVRLFTLDGVAVAGDTVYAPASDDAGSAVLAFDTATGALRWRGAGGGGQPVEAGGLVYTERDDTSGTKVAITSADPCGTPTCPVLKILDTGTSQSSFEGMSVSEGTLFVNKAGVGVLAFTPAFSSG